MRCDGVCGKDLKPGDPVIEVERTHVFCTDCALVTTVDRLVEYANEPSLFEPSLVS